MLTFFIADDSAAVRESLAALVSGIEGIMLVGQSENAADAIEAIRRLMPDVVIFDIHMPVGNAIQTLKAFKAINPHLCLIMLTAFPSPQYRQKYLKAGADFFFDKDTELNHILEVLEKCRAKQLSSFSCPQIEKYHDPIKD